VITAALVVASAATAFGVRQKPEYVATAKVLLQPITGNALAPGTTANGQLVTVAMETEAGLVASPGVTALVEKNPRRPTGNTPGAVTATVPPNTQIVQIQYTATSAAAARDGAQLYAESFLKYRAAQSDASRTHQLDSLKKQVKSAESGLKAATTAAAATAPSPDATVEVQLFATRLSSLQDSMGQLQAADDAPGTVITPAELPKHSSGISPVLVTLAGLLVGLGLGLVLAFWREKLDDRLRASENTLAGGLNVLALLPREGAEGQELVSHQDATEATRLAYRHARTQVVASAPSPCVLVVCGATPREPVAGVAANLALSLAGAGFTTTLVDATLEGRGAKDLLEVRGGPGLSDVLAGSHAAPSGFVSSHGMTFLGRGPDPLVARELYPSDRFKRLIDSLRGRNDYVVVAAPALPSPDGMAVALAGDRVVLVVSDRQTRHLEVSRMAGHAAGLGVEVLGVVSVLRRRGFARQVTAGVTTQTRRGGSYGRVSLPVDKRTDGVRPPLESAGALPVRDAS
jgi:Mrp family chromosome partitioning ATPase/capsular polysaccharide biosynthesis protein